MPSFIVGCVLFSLTWQSSFAYCYQKIGIGTCVTDQENIKDLCLEKCSRTHPSCHGLIDRFGTLEKYRCHCKKLGDCNFHRNGTCGGGGCLPGYRGITCQIRLYHHFLAVVNPGTIFSDSSMKCDPLPLNLKLNYEYRIHTIILHSLKSLPQIDGTDFKCDVGAKLVKCTGDTFTNRLKISSDTPNQCVTRIELEGCPPTLYGATCTSVCYCKKNGWCHQWTGFCKDGCEEGHVGSDCQDTSYENIALGRLASQSSTYGHNLTRLFSHEGKCTQKIAPMYGSYAVDGTYDPSYEHHTCTSTLNVRNNWWQVKLDRVYNLTQFRIYNRNTQKSRFKDFRVLVNSGPNGSFVKAHQSSSTEHTKDIIYIRLKKPIQGDILKIEGPHAMLTLCEVEIIKCKHGYHGYLCTKHCSSLCVNNDCSDSDGRCTSACLDGYSWNRSKRDCKECTPGKYGTHCDGKCNCRKKDICDRVTGICPRGCPPGFRSATCQKACRKGTYGDECRKRCHCIDSSCNPENGHCAHGCEAGYLGESCQEFCKEGTYGINCTKTCNCADDDACNPMHGACPRGCFPGYGGSGCQDECAAGTYGDSCSGVCNCLDKAPCNIINGTCSNGCEITHTGADCQTPTHIIEIIIAIGILVSLVLIAVCICCW
uniref:Fucolectin tachylectin-4 pentraxin-1 domain-containing protein n=2 Tax=Octopus bimaculoides TaxID=37653 RepID=A0A0L8HVM8_OCTBM